MAHPIFRRSVNPISTRGKILPTTLLPAPRIFGRCGVSAYYFNIFTTFSYYPRWKMLQSIPRKTMEIKIHLGEYFCIILMIKTIPINIKTTSDIKTPLFDTPPSGKTVKPCLHLRWPMENILWCSTKNWSTIYSPFFHCHIFSNDFLPLPLSFYEYFL